MLPVTQFSSQEEDNNFGRPESILLNFVFTHFTILNVKLDCLHDI